MKIKLITIIATLLSTQSVNALPAEKHSFPECDYLEWTFSNPCNELATLVADAQSGYSEEELLYSELEAKVGAIVAHIEPASEAIIILMGLIENQDYAAANQMATELMGYLNISPPEPQPNAE